LFSMLMLILNKFIKDVHADADADADADLLS
jgi:hypothetical protein